LGSERAFMTFTNVFMAAPYILKMEYIDWFDMCQLFF